MLDEVLKSNIIGQDIQVIYPNGGTSIEEQAKNCIQQVSDYLNSVGYSSYQIIKFNFFVKCNNNKVKSIIDKSIIRIAQDFFVNFIPASIIPEAPVDPYDLILEATILPDLEKNKVAEGVSNNFHYLTAVTEKGKYIVACGLHFEMEFSDIHRQSIAAFEQMQLILDNENLSYNNIVRQWNYIEDIVGNTNSNQHYQIFNDVRSAYYNKSIFDNGYPSATGIGMSCAGVIIDFIAFEPSAGTEIVAIKSPVQTDAHHYSKQVLAENIQITEQTSTTPKFERAKIIINAEQGIVYVSGTAAIKGELSAQQYNVAQQTLLTFDNINALVSPKNLAEHGIPNVKKTEPQYFRVYLKNREDFKTIESIVAKSAGTVPTVVIEADICRPELLVEIEAIYSIKYR